MIALLWITAALAQGGAEQAQALLQEGRVDEAVAVLTGDVSDPAASTLLAQTLLNAPPRLAWLSAAEALYAEQPAALVEAWIYRTRAGDPDLRAKALRQMEALRRSQPENLRVRRMAAEALMFSPRLDAALAVDPGAVPESCQRPMGALGCAQALTEQGARDLAAARLTASLPGLPPEQQVSAHAELAQLAALRGDTDAQIRHLSQAHKGRPGDAMLRQQLLAAYLWQFRVEEASEIAVTEAERAAVAATRKVRGGGLDAAGFAAAAAAAPTQGRVLAAQAQHLLEQGNGAAAMPLLTDAIRYAGPRTDLLNLAAWAATTGGDPATAVAAFRAGLAAAPDAQTWRMRLVSLADMLVAVAEREKASGDGSAAAETYALAAALTPSRASVWMGYGGALWASGDLAGAQRAYAEAHALAPDDREALLSLVGLLRAQGKSDEAYRLVEASSLDDDQIRSLEAELVVLAAARPAEAAAAAGRTQEALERYQALELAYPGHPELLHRLADLRAANGEPEVAISLYRQAQRKSPDTPWLYIGEARALIGLGEKDLALELLEQAPTDGDEAAAAEVALLRREVARREAGQLAANQPAEALERYAALLEASPTDPWTLGAIAQLYAQDRQPAAALLFYDEALAHAPPSSTGPFAEGRIRAMLALGRHEEALAEASRAYRETGDEIHLALAREAERQLQLRRVTALIDAGRLELAEVSLRRRLEVAPDDVEARTVLAALLLATDRPEDAFDEAVTALEVAPGDADALTVLRRAGDVLDRSDEVLPYYSRTEARWAQQEADFLALDAALTAAIRDPDPELAIQTVAEQQAGASARRWVMVGGAWLEAGEPAHAQGAFEVALSLDPQSTDAARGLAGALQARGEGERAADVLRLLWADTHDPVIGAQLLALLQRLGRPLEARDLRAELDADAAAAHAPAGSSVTQLRVLPTPSGKRAEPAEPAPTPLEVVLALQPAPEARDQDTPAGQVEVAITPGQIRRPGTAGAQRLTAQFATLGAEWTPPLPLWVGAAAIPMRVSDGEVTADGLIPGGWLGVGGDQISLEVSAATTPLQLDPEPRLTGRVALDGRPAQQVGLSLYGGQMAATDTTTSWLGRDSVGRAMDRWLGGSVLWQGPTEVGLLGRFGETTAIGLDSLPWQQAQAWARRDFIDEPEGTISGHVEGMLLQHDEQVGGFTAGQAAIFSPLGYYAAMGRLELERDFSRWGACAHAALGPQHITGEDTLFLGTGTWLGYRFEGGLWAELTESLQAKAGYRIEGTWGTWYQELALLQLAVTPPKASPAADRVSMRLPAGSPVHGIPITAPSTCGGSR